MPTKLNVLPTVLNAGETMFPRFLALMLLAGVAAVPHASARTVVGFTGLPEDVGAGDVCVTGLPQPGVSLGSGCGTATMEVTVGPLTITVTIGPGATVSISYCQPSGGLAYVGTCLDDGTGYNSASAGAGGAYVKAWTDPGGSGDVWGAVCYRKPMSSEQCVNVLR